MSIRVRQEKEVDYASVFELNTVAFGQEGEAKLVDALRLNKDVFIPQLSLVAADGKEIIGHILFTKIQIVDDSGESHQTLALGPMAVLPKFQNRGVGSRLIKRGFQVAKKLGFKSVIVLGHAHYYPKFGFEPAEEWDIRAPFDIPSNVFMAIELVKNGLEGVSGTVKYPKEFDGV